MSSVKRWAEQNGLLEPRSQQEQDAYWDGDEKIGYRTNDCDLFELDPPSDTVTIHVEMKKETLFELEQFLSRMLSSKSFPSSPRANRLKSAIEILLMTSPLK